MGCNKKAIFLFFILIFGLNLCSCSNKFDLKEDFISCNETKLNNQIFSTSTGHDMIILNFEKEDTSTNPKVVLTLGIGGVATDNEATYKWLQLSPEERKSELKEFGNLVIQYAKDNNWKNDYYLYIVVSYVYDGNNIIYDYEQDSIWIPNCEDTFIEMYEKFNTFYKKNLEESQDGIDFLISKDLAYMKHDQVEYNHTSSYSVYISDGKFESYNEEDSTKY